MMENLKINDLTTKDLKLLLQKKDEMINERINEKTIPQKTINPKKHDLNL
jgi:hypothetical protein